MVNATSLKLISQFNYIYFIGRKYVSTFLYFHILI